MMCCKMLCLWTLVFLLTPWEVTGQWASWQNQNPINDKENFFMDSNAECNKQYDIGLNHAYLFGHGAVGENNPPKSCQITFSTDKVGEKRKFRIEVESANFAEDGVEFYIYDSSTTVSLLDGFGYQQDKPKNYRPLITSGGFVTFQLIRSFEGHGGSYNIKVNVISIPGDVNVIDECPTGDGPGCNYYNYQSPITKEIILGIVGGVFGLIIFIIVPIVVICCYRKSKGVNRRWDEFKLGQGNTAADISKSKGTVKATSHDTKSKLWASQSSKTGLSSTYKPHARSIRPSEDEDSVFDDGPPRNYPPPPPPYEKYDRNGRRERDRPDNRNKNGRYDRRDDDNGRKDRRNRDRDDREPRDRDDRYDREPRDRDDRYDRESRRERDRRQRDSPPRRSYHSDSNSEMESSFIQGEDDHPQENFVERIIEPRVKPKAKVAKVVEDDVYDELSEDLEAIKDSSVQCGPSDDDNESNTETTDDDSSESESDSEEEKKKKVDPRIALYAKPNKKGKNSQQEQPQPGTMSYANSHMMAGQPMSAPPMMGQPMAGHPMAMMRPPVPGIIPGVVVRPVSQPPYVPGQNFAQPPSMMRPGVPIQPGPMQFRPVQPGYPAGTGLPQQHPPPQKSHHPQPQMAVARPPLDPPMYSYLVQRGYTDRYSPASSTGASSDVHVVNLTDDSEGGANLPSGVDLMKRTTDV